MKLRFRSDNNAGVSPEIMDALLAANNGLAPSYGDDETTAAMAARVSEVFERKATTLPVGTGVAANAVALSVVAGAGSKILVHENAHVLLKEDGAVQHGTGGAELVPVGGANGMMAPVALKAAIAGLGSAPAAISVTQLSEAGPAYDLATIVQLAEIAHDAGAKVHMDGARFANALAHLGCSPAEMSWKAGIDLMSFGTSKNGTMCAEAVVVFDDSLAEHASGLMRRSGQLYSKMRFFSVQLDAYLSDDLWRKNASHANEMASRLASGLLGHSSVEIQNRVDGNLIFVRIPVSVSHALKAAGFEIFLMADKQSDRPIHRLVTSFMTTPGEIEQFLAAFANAAEPR